MKRPTFSQRLVFSLTLIGALLLVTGLPSVVPIGITALALGGTIAGGKLIRNMQ